MGDLRWSSWGSDGLQAQSPEGLTVWVNRSRSAPWELSMDGDVLWSVGHHTPNGLMPQSAVIGLVGKKALDET